MPRGVKKSKEDNKKTIVDNTETETKVEETKTENQKNSDTTSRKRQKNSTGKKTKTTKETKTEEIKTDQEVKPTEKEELTQKAKQIKETKLTQETEQTEQTEKAKPKAHKNRKKITTEDILSDIIIQYGGEEVSALDIVQRVKQDCKDKNYRKQIRRVSIYVKPEDGKAYYALEGSSDSIDLFKETQESTSMEQ